MAALPDGVPMRIALVACAAALATVTLHASQDQKKKSNKPTIVVTGCLDGTWLRVQKSDAFGGYVERYKLRGAKQVLKEMGTKYHRHRDRHRRFDPHGQHDCRRKENHDHHWRQGCANQSIRHRRSDAGSRIV